MKHKIKQWIGIGSALTVVSLALVGIYSLIPLISIYGAALILVLLVITFKYV